MGKTSTKPILYALVLPLLLLQFTSLVSAVSLTFFANSSDCLGIGVACPDFPEKHCCAFGDREAASLSVTSVVPGVRTQVSGGGGCTTVIGQARGDICFVGNGITGAAWTQDEVRRRALLDETVDSFGRPERCKNPDSIVYANENGRWVLNRDDAIELFSQMKDVVGQEVEDWITGNGGIYEPSQ